MDTLSDEDEAVASDLDLHALIVGQNPPDLDIEPLQSAEEVIKEIDDLMQVSSTNHQNIDWEYFYPLHLCVGGCMYMYLYNVPCFE